MLFFSKSVSPKNAPMLPLSRIEQIHALNGRLTKDIEKIWCRCETITLQEEDADQVVPVSRVDHEPGPKKCEVWFADCLAQDDKEHLYRGQMWKDSVKMKWSYWRVCWLMSETIKMRYLQIQGKWKWRKTKLPKLRPTTS